MMRVANTLERPRLMRPTRLPCCTGFATGVLADTAFRLGAQRAAPLCFSSFVRRFGSATFASPHTHRFTANQPRRLSSPGLRVGEDYREFDH